MSADYTIIVIGVIIAISFFALQLLLCFKAKRLSVKLIPVYINMLFVLLMAADFAGLFSYGGFIQAQRILALVFAVIAIIALIAELMAWMVYGIRKRNK